MITIRHLKKEYPSSTPLVDVNVEIKKGDVISIIGPSGTGKSTLIRCINMLETPTAGEVIVDGRNLTDGSCDINKVRQKMGMVFQSFNLFNHMTVIENLMAAPVDLMGKTKQEAFDRGRELLKAIGLADKMLSYPDELSGGQKQRAAIARTLAMDPEIILFDEPTSALDPAMKGEVESVIKGLAQKGLTMLIVTHDMRLAREVANRVFYMDQGGIYEDGTPQQIFEHPERELTRRFVSRNFAFEVEIQSRDFDFLGLVTELERFGQSHYLSRRTLNHLQSAFEEMCMQSLIPHFEGDFKMKITVSCLAAKDQVNMEIKYTGGRFDPMNSDDILALKILESVTEKIEYTDLTAEGKSADGPFTNLIHMKIR